MAYALEKPLTVIVRSRISGLSDAMLMC